MARGDDNDERIAQLEQRSAQLERELVVLADTIKDLAAHVQQVAQAQVSIIDSHDELLQKIVDMDRTLAGISGRSNE